MKEYPYFPLFVDLSEKHIIVIGAGKIAARRIQTLFAFTKNITVIAPEIHSEIETLADGGNIQIFRKFYESKDIDNADMVLAATDSEIINEQVYCDCKQRNTLVNVCNDRQKCDFYFPGIYMEEDLVVGVTASGLDHKKAKRLREEIQGALERVAKE